LWGILVAWLFFGPASGFSSPAQTNAVKGPPPNRWLFVVETSKHMAPRAKATGQTVASLLWSGLNGQIRPGDTVGVWTFNEDVYTGRFPLQVWLPDSREEITAELFNFLSAQKFEKASRLDKAVAKISRIIARSDYITVMLVSDGSEKVHGTPFDDKINGTFQSWSKAQEKSLIPFVTILRAEHGVIRHYAVAMPPWPLEMPPLPAALTHSAPVAPPPSSAPAAVVRMAPPLIVHGAEPKPEAPNSSGASSFPQARVPAANVLPVQARTPAAAASVAVAAPNGAAPHPATTAATVTQGTFLGRRALWIAFAVMTVIVIGIVALRVRKSRSAPRISLVFHSPDRRNKR
jgi:hypothetical protein